MDSGFRFGIIERVTVAAFIAGIFGVVASVTLPAPYQEALAKTGLGPYLFWISVACIAFTVVFFIGDLALYFLKRRRIKLGMAMVMVGTTMVVFGGLVGLIGAFKIDAVETTTPPSEDHPPTMLQFFERNQAKFPSASKQTVDTTLTFSDGRQLTVKSDLYRDILARTMFMAFYIPRSQLTFDAIIALSDGYKDIMRDMMSGLIINGKIPGSSVVTQDELTFTGRIFIFHEDDISLQERAQADTVFKAKKLGVQFRGIEELMAQWGTEQQAKKH